MDRIEQQTEALADKVEAELFDVYKKIDRIAFLNQKKVLEAFREERVSTECFNPTTGYGYDDTRPTDYKSVALPTELYRRLKTEHAYYSYLMPICQAFFCVFSNIVKLLSQLE